jgi:hypothetical protein
MNNLSYEISSFPVPPGTTNEQFLRLLDPESRIVVNIGAAADSPLLLFTTDHLQTLLVAGCTSVTLQTLPYSQYRQLLAASAQGLLDKATTLRLELRRRPLAALADDLANCLLELQTTQVLLSCLLWQKSTAVSGLEPAVLTTWQERLSHLGFFQEDSSALFDLLHFELLPQMQTFLHQFAFD